MLLVLFLVFIFVHFYLVKCTFLQNIVNYDAWHTFGLLPLAGVALESCFDVLALAVFSHGFGTPAFLPRVFHHCVHVLGVFHQAIALGIHGVDAPDFHLGPFCF